MKNVRIVEQLAIFIANRPGTLADICDALAEANGIQRFSSPRLAVQASHGTGCTLSAAITSQLALGAKLPVAIANAKSYLNETLRQSYSFQSPNGEVIHALNQGTDFERVGSTF